jgi:biotin operon repressor
MRRSIAVLGAAGLLAVAAGCGGSATTSSTSAGGTSNTAATQPGRPDSTSLAEKLGVSTARLQQAMQAIRPTGETPPSPGTMAAALAKELRISTSKVQAAMESVRLSGTPPPDGAGAPPQQSQS